MRQRCLLRYSVQWLPPLHINVPILFSKVKAMPGTLCSPLCSLLQFRQLQQLVSLSLGPQFMHKGACTLCFCPSFWLEPEFPM